MPNLNHAISVGVRGISNSIMNRAYSISFEVTRSCNAKCQHCHLRGTIPDEVRATAADYAQRCRELLPVVAMVSGGEPLLRKDLVEIIKALKAKGKAVYITMTTNGALFSKKKYTLINQVKDGQKEAIEKTAEKYNLDIIGFVPESQDVSDFDLNGRPTIELDMEKVKRGICGNVNRDLLFYEHLVWSGDIINHSSINNDKTVLLHDREVLRL